MKKIGEKFRIDVCSDIDYERLIAEINFENSLVALISHETGVSNLMIEFPGSVVPGPRSIPIPLSDFLDAVSYAKNRLVKGVH